MTRFTLGAERGWRALSLPATFAVIATSLDRSKHTMGVGVQSMVHRVPMIIGPLMGGWLIANLGWERGIRFRLLGCIALGATTAPFQWFMADSFASGRSVPPKYSFLAIVNSFNPTLRELLVSDILIRFCERLPYAFVILWAMNHAGVTAGQYGWLVAIEMITAMLCYIPVAHLADKRGQRPFVLVTFIFFSLFPLSLLAANALPTLAFAFFVRGLIRDCVVTTGSFLGAWLWSISPKANFMGAAFSAPSGAGGFSVAECQPAPPEHSKFSRETVSPLLVPDNLHEHSLTAPAIEFSVEDLLPRPEVQLAVGNGNDDFTPHDLPLQVRVGIVFPRAIMLVMRGRRVRRELLQPDLVIVKKPALVVVDEDRSGGVRCLLAKPVSLPQ